jgi:PAS domain S-box-containing protein
MFAANTRDLSEVLDCLDVPIWIKDDQCRFLVINCEYERLQQCDRADFIGKTVHDVYPREFADRFDSDDKRVLETGETVREENEVPHPDGVTRTFIHVRSPLRDGSGRICGIVGLGTDITALKRAAEELHEAHQPFEQAFRHASIGMALVSVEGLFMRVKHALCDLTGYTETVLLGKTFQEITHPDDLAQDVAHMEQLLAGDIASYEMEKRYFRSDDTMVRVLLSVSVVRDAQDKPLYFVSQIQDITERWTSDHALRTSERLLRAIIDNTPGAVSVKGLDHRYQLVNHGFEQGFGVQRGEVVGRLDEEILAPSMLALERESDEIVLRTDAPHEHEEVVPGDREDHVYLTVKFPLRDDARKINAFCTIFDDITDRKRREEELQARLQWTDRIHEAAANNLLVLEGQPIVSLASGQIEHAELLVRMRDGPGSASLIPPGEFLPDAERLGLIHVIDLWVVARAVDLAQIHSVAINLSGKTISDPDHLVEIERLVVDSGAPPANIIFEITETAVAEHLPAAREFAERMGELGCSLALDDFGVGFGTFTYLKHLPVDYLKIDIEFIRALVTDEGDRQVVQAIVGVARDLEMKTVAEGVEDPTTLELLGLMGVDYAQGYWIGRPTPLEELWPATRKKARTR